MGAHFLGILLSFLGALSLALLALSVRKGTTGTGGNAREAVLVVLVIATVVHVSVALIVYYPKYYINVHSLLAFIGAGIAGSVLGRGLYYLSISRIGAVKTESIKTCSPFFSLSFAVLFLREQLTWLHALGAVLIIVGIWLVVRRSPLREVKRVAVQRRDVLVPVAAAFFYAMEPVCVRLGLISGAPFLMGLAVQSVTAMLTYALYWIVRKDFPKIRLRSRSLPWYIGAGVASTGFLFLFNGALSVSSVVVVVPIIYTSPLLVAAVSLLFLRDLERVTRWLAVGAVLVVCGAIVVSL